jgi:MbtH protein
MSDHEADESIEYLVVVNHEEQYSIWPSYKKPIPLGWAEAGKRGSKEECLAYISEVWTDMRPASLRRRMEEGDPAARSTGTA